MTLPRYEQYKPSNVEWLGEIPSHWEVKSLRGLSDGSRGSFIDGDWIESPYITDEGVRLIQTGNVGVGFYKEQGFRYISENTFSELNCTEVLPGDVLICRLAEPVGRACLAPELGTRMITSVDVCILKTNSDNDAHFVVYLLSSAHYLSFMEAQCRGGTRDRVSRSFLGSVRVALPERQEQTAIAAFLDRETGKIDVLVAEQRRLIDLLKEKRQAVISHAVTKGLNPNAPMKDSGIEWLGQVPNHWTVVKIGHHAEVTKLTGFEYTNHWKPVESGEIIGLRGFNIGAREINLDNTETITCELSDFLIRSKLFRGDIVMPCTGTLGSAAVVEEDNRYHINQNIAKVSFDPLVNPYYGVYWLTSGIFKTVIEHNNMSGMQPVLLIGDIRRMRIPLPPVDEQNQIAAFLDQETSKFKELISEAERAIALLKERRTALISAAVTGKIDVRGQADLNISQLNQHPEPALCLV